MSQKFSVNIAEAADEVRLEFLGSLNEHAKLPAVTGKSRVRVNLRNLTGINSLGTKAWVTWSATMKAPVTIHLEECPVVFVKSFTIVKGFLADNMRVESFLIPFYSPQSGERTDFLVVRGRHFETTLDKVPELKDSKGNLFELDINKAYLSFLKA